MSDELDIEETDAEEKAEASAEESTKEETPKKRGRVKHPEPDAEEIICPIIFKLTAEHWGLENARAVSYDRRWVATQGMWCFTPMITLNEDARKRLDQATTDEEKLAFWKDASEDDVREDSRGQKAWRSYSILFYEWFYQQKVDGKIPEKVDNYFCTHEQAVKAREIYEKGVLEGKIKAHQTSWKNKHSKFTGKSWDDLKEEVDAKRKEKELDPFYAKGTSQKRKNGETVSEELTREAAVEMGRIVEEELEETEALLDIEQEPVAAVSEEELDDDDVAEIEAEEELELEEEDDDSEE